MIGKSVKLSIIAVTPSENGSSSLETEPQGIKFNSFFLKPLIKFCNSFKKFNAFGWNKFRYKKR
jgi:hypothetical protein